MSPSEPTPQAGPKGRSSWIVAGLVSLGLVSTAVWQSGQAADRVADHVHVASVDLGGKTREEAAGALAELVRSWPERNLLLVLDGKEVSVRYDELGSALNLEATLDAASAAGREPGVGGLLKRVGRVRTDVTPVATVDPQNFEALVRDWEHSLIADLPFDGALEFEGITPIAKLPRNGRRIDAETLRQRIEHTLGNQQASVPVPVLEVAAAIDAAEVNAAHEQAKVLLAGPITLSYTPSEQEVELLRQEREAEEKRRKEADSARKWRVQPKKNRVKRKGRRFVADAPEVVAPLPEQPLTVEITFSQADLLAALRARRVDEPRPHFEVLLDPAEVKTKLAPIVAQLYDAARDARFDIDESGKITVVPSRPGTRVDTSRLVQTLLAAARTADRRGDLPVDKDAQPKFTTQDAEALGIKTVVADFSSHHACCQPRVQNIHRIANMIDGTIVKPGETFSVNAIVGPRTVSRGFVLAPSIGDGEMVETPGGGVSQFATALFNAVFDAGYTIKERKAHSFYFQRYPMGIEATLSYPSPDLAFYNDSKSAVLIRCTWGDTFIRVRLFGDVGTRRTERHVSAPFAYTDPRIEYEADARRDPEKEKVKESGSKGFSVTATRVITYESGEKRTEKRVIKYNARPRVLIVHPCMIPKGEKGHTGEKCPEKEEPEGDADGQGGGG